MAQYVFEFGAVDPTPVCDTIAELSAPSPCEIQVLRTENAQSLKYEKTNESLKDVFAMLKSGRIVSLITRPRVKDIRYTLIVAPCFHGQALSLWMGTVEFCESEWSTLWQSLLKHKGLRFVCLGLEEGVELEDRHLSVETFPWNDWPMVIGALRTDPSDSGDWVIRSNPEHDPS